MQNVLTFILGGGQGARLYPLTKYRSEPAVPFAGKYRLIDIPLSNCINSGLRRIHVLTQFQSVSLHRHIRQAYRFDEFGEGYVEVLAAQQTMDDGRTDWYEGTADAVRKNVRYIEQRGVDYVLILSGDQLYRMDFIDMLRRHEQSRADVSIAALPVDREAAKSFGVMRIGETNNVTKFIEKPQTDEQIHAVSMSAEELVGHGFKDTGRDCLASMGIYLFNRDVLVHALRSSTHHDFARGIFPSMLETRLVQVHPFHGYWQDIGSVRAFYEANLAMASSHPPMDLTLPECVMFTRSRFLPPSRVDGAALSGSLVSDGCQIGRGAIVENSVIGLRCVIQENAVIRNSIVMGADEFEAPAKHRDAAKAGCPPVGIARDTVIENAILDKNCRIGANVVIRTGEGAADRDGEGFAVRDGLTIIEKDATIPDHWRLPET